MTSKIPLSSFLNLPRELRYEIYDYLCGQEAVSYPFRAPPITSFDQTPPPTNLQLTNRFIYEEIRSYFYGKVTLSFVPQPILRGARSLSRATRNAIPPLALVAIRQAKKAEVALVWNLNTTIAGAMWNNWSRIINRWLDELVDLFLHEAANLEVVSMSVRDASENVGWENRITLLQPLNKLKWRVLFQVGEVIVADREEAILKENLKKYLDALNE
ncbi:hypothetical protein N0V83_007100 [Neocucurbitaria cava]|uniref:Uncharacterized protein n=1 Tax=Neocucurbitaria cava TaxID=798079 RepID=A0A9W8Y4B3_9PLEO|nr:hypothetical protein N0V83_007100 [Neocucurbitaria cava]